MGQTGAHGVSSSTRLSYPLMSHSSVGGRGSGRAVIGWNSKSQFVNFPLKRPIGRPSDESIPELHPCVKARSALERRCGEQMQMIRHDDVTTHEPIISFAPRSSQEVMHGGARQPRVAVFRANGCENQYGLIWLLVNTGGRSLAVGKIDGCQVHSVWFSRDFKLARPARPEPRPPIREYQLFDQE